MVLPDVIKEKLTRDQYRLYKLIWQRFVASQMEAAVYDTIAVDIAGKGKLHQYLLRATGSKLRFQGFLIVYQETRDEDKPDEDEENVEIPIESLMVGQKQILKAIIPEQHFTQPPPRFTDASLIQILEENGIGRPSTYAPIISTIQERGYVVRETKRLFPTEIGFIVNDLIVEYFPEVVDIGFTSKMEEKLDDIAEGKQEWVNVIRDFYLPFEKRLENAHKHMPENKAPLEEVGRSCPKCGNELVIRFGKYGKFISCSNFPSCRYTEPWLEKIDVACPICESGEIVERRTKRGRIFYGCSRFPECDFSSWKRPISTKCPNCGGTLVELNKKEAQCLACEKTYLLNKLAIQEEQEA
jgi:DNA topoisomerase-1